MVKTYLPRLLCLIAVLLGESYCSSAPKDMSATSFTLLDAQGHPAAVLSMNAGAPQLLFYDAKQKKRLALFLESNGTPDVFLYDAQGEARAYLDLCDSGTGNLGFGGADGKHGITTYGRVPDGLATLAFEIRKGKLSRTGYMLSADGTRKLLTGTTIRGC